MNEQINDGGPAFPSTEEHGLNSGWSGLSLRDYFAAKAMNQMIAGAVLPAGYDATEGLRMVAARAYEMADAMIHVRAA